MSTDFGTRLGEEPWVYWIDPTQPAPERPGLFRVSIVFANDPHHYPTGRTAAEGFDVHKDPTPWYWDEKACATQNAGRGYDQDLTSKIVFSSMGRQRTFVRDDGGGWRAL